MRRGGLTRPEIGNKLGRIAMPERRTAAAVGRLAVSLLLLTITAACTSSQAATGNTVTFYIFNEPGGSFVRAADTCTKASQGRYNVQLALLPSGADGQRQQLVRRLPAHAPHTRIPGSGGVW